MESNKNLYSTLNLQPTSKSVVPNKLFTNSIEQNPSALSTTIGTNYDEGAKTTTMVPYIRNEEAEDEYINTANLQQSSNKIVPFVGKKGMFNDKFYNNLLKQFDRTFLSKLVDMHNVMAKDKINLNDVESVLEFLIHYKKELSASYLYALIFPEKSKGCRIPTKFPIPSMAFQQRSCLTITPNSSSNWYLQWTPQSLLSSAYVTPNNGNLLLNNASALTGSVIDSTAANYTSITVDRLQNANMIQAYRLVSASMIITYVGSVDAHSGVIGGGIDISYVDSLFPDTASSVFSTIDDKIWNMQVNPYEGMRLIYFPKDYNDLSFIRPDISTQTNGVSTCLRFLIYGQNMPLGASVRVDLYRNFEGIPFPGMSDFVSMDFYKSKSVSSSSNEPAIDAGSKIAESKVTITKISDEDKLNDFAISGGNIGFDDYDKDETIHESYEQDTGIIGKIGGTIVDIAKGLGKTLIGEVLDDTIGNVPFVGKYLSDWIGNKIIS
jgi:hypothetical protein